MAAVSDFSALISGYTWYQQDTVGKPVFLTYSFPTTVPTYTATDRPDGVSSFKPLTESEKQTIRDALKAWSDVSGVQFFETRMEGDLTFAFYDLARMGGSGAAGLGGYPAPFVTSGSNPGIFSGENLGSGDVWFDVGYRSSSSFAGDFKHVALHEIGHALGLKHPFDTTAGHPNVLTAQADKGTNTVMSYDNATRASVLGPLDIAAARSIYGDASAKGTQVASWSWDPTLERLTEVGKAAAEFIRGTGANDIIYSMGGHDVIYTAQGNDVIVAAGVPIDVNGGSGRDIVLTGLAYKTGLLQGSLDFSYISTGGDFMTFAGVERIGFTDKTVALDTAGNAGQAYRLYEAAFDRTPDQGGLSYWVGRLDASVSLRDVAYGFVASAEFRQIYGANPTSVALVSKFYQNILDRPGEQAGIDYWVGKLNSSTALIDVLAGFSEGAENIAKVAPKIAGGILLDAWALV